MSNLLSQSRSPYLLQHKDNPVNWMPWSKEALDMAKTENKPILVSIGYSTCHWCHVMAHECFEKIEIAKIMNSYFINIKIDREERPDLDHYFMNAVQLMGIHGGWPLHCFLTPDLKPFYGGTYFPPEPKYGRISWPDLLMAIQNAFQFKSNEVEMQAEKLSNVLNDQLNNLGNNNASENLNSILSQALTECSTYMDMEYGGFGNSQKFPNTMCLNFLLENNRISEANVTNNFIRKTLDRMCYIGLYDHLIGGFYRYTVDRLWQIPHFEKMGYDNALIIPLLAAMDINSNQIHYKYFVDQTISFWKSEMKGENGLFYSAMDADSNGKEGLFYLWSNAEIDAAIGNEQQDILSYLKLNDMHHEDGSVLSFENLINLELPQRLDHLRSWEKYFKKLYSIRNNRVKPSIDHKYIFSWNCLWLIQFSQCFKLYGDSNYHNEALDLYNAILSCFTINDKVDDYCRICYDDHSQIGKAFLEDIIYWMNGLLSLYEITANENFINTIQNHLDKLDLIFYSKDGIYSMTGPLHENVLSPVFDLKDSSIPNPNALLADLYLKLWLITLDNKYYNHYESMLNQWLQCKEKSYFSYSSWLRIVPEAIPKILILKTRKVETAVKFNQWLRISNVLYIYDQSIPIDTVQICTHSMCYPIINSKEEAEEFRKSLN